MSDPRFTRSPSDTAPPKPLPPETLAALAVGDAVTRWLGGQVPMRMLVVAVTETLITCTVDDPSINPADREHYRWTFDRHSGAEIDEDLGWGPAFGVTGSYLGPKSHGL